LKRVPRNGGFNETRKNLNGRNSGRGKLRSTHWIGGGGDRVEDALKKAQRQLGEAVRLAHLAYWEDDFVANRVRWSNEGCRMLGLPADERSRTWDGVLALVHPEDRALVDESRARAKGGESDYQLAFRVVRPNGDLRYLIVIIDVVRDRLGRPTRAIGAAQDVTELRRAERAQGLYRALIDRTTDMAEVVDPDTGQFLDVNEEACRVHGFSREEYLSLRVSEVDPTLGDPGTFARNVAHLSQVGSLSLEGQRRRKDGSLFPVEVRLSYARLDRDYLLAVVRDLTNRKRSEAALRGSEERLQLALLATGLGPWDWDLRTGAVEFSPEWKRQLGYEPDEIESRYEEWENRLHPDDRERVLAALRAYLDGQRPEYAEEFRLRHKDGSYRWIYTRGVALRDAAGNMTNMLGCNLDVSERKRREEQYRRGQKMEVIGQLAAGVAHDFNNLLTIISGYSEILLPLLPATDPKREMVAAIREAGGQAGGLTRQLLAFSRQTVQEPKILDLNELVRENEKMLRRLIGEDILLTTVLEPALEPVEVDPGQISQVVMNLAVNARDIMPTGGKLTIQTSPVTLDETAAAFGAGAKPGRYVLLAVTDAGAGMTPEVQAQIFEPFFTTKGAGKGTGLGLATVYKIVEQSGGFIFVDSDPGRGTTFKLYFPVAEGPASTSHIDTKPLTRGTETILLVEDEDAVRTIVRTVLQQAGYTVLDAGRGSVALRLAGEHAGPIHLLITDVVMPEMGGRELVEKLGRLRPDIRVLYLSGFTDDAIVRHGVLQAEVAFLHKPFTIAALTNKVREVLEGVD
jgi:two-component system, cell cycle sensor histidine kinase and response regulator CckA